MAQWYHRIKVLEMEKSSVTYVLDHLDLEVPQNTNKIYFGE